MQWLPHSGANSGTTSDTCARLRAARMAACALAACIAIAGCTHVHPHYDPTRAHHTPSGFRNNYLDHFFTGSFWAWQWQRWRQGLPKPPASVEEMQPVPANLSWLQQNRSEPAATWIGHATVLLQAGGLNILTDPMLSERASPVSWAGPKRKTPPALALTDLPRIDVVIVSHNHYDHLDLPTLKALNTQAGGPPLFLVPLGVGDWLRRHGISHFTQLDWWQSLPVHGVRLHCVPVQHWSARGLFDRFETLWSGWVIETEDERRLKIFFTGDTGYSRDFADITQRFGAMDFAMIPIGAYEPRWFMRHQHVDPAEAVQIHLDLRARRSLGIHWGAFELTDEPLDDPPRALRQALQARGVDPQDFVTLRPGVTLQFGHFIQPAALTQP